MGQDDLGWGSLQYNNPQGPRTPAIDALLATSIRLDRAYAYKFCSPSRCSLLSGRLPIHVNTDNDAVSPSPLPLHSSMHDPFGRPTAGTLTGRGWG